LREQWEVDICTCYQIANGVFGRKTLGCTNITLALATVHNLRPHAPFNHEICGRPLVI